MCACKCWKSAGPGGDDPGVPEDAWVMDTNPVILVANKTDLVRNRVSCQVQIKSGVSENVVTENLNKTDIKQIL